MKLTLATTLLAGFVAVPALAGGHASGDAAAGEKAFNQCKACHAIVDADGNDIVKGGKTGPNLYGVLGRTAGTIEGFGYSDELIAAGQGGLVWTQETLTEYLTDPKAYLQRVLDDSAANPNMRFKLAKPDNVVAYLATFSE